MKKVRREKNAKITLYYKLNVLAFISFVSLTFLICILTCIIGHNNPSVVYSAITFGLILLIVFSGAFAIVLLRIRLEKVRIKRRNERLKRVKRKPIVLNEIQGFSKEEQKTLEQLNQEKQEEHTETKQLEEGMFEDNEKKEEYINQLIDDIMNGKSSNVKELELDKSENEKIEEDINHVEL